MSLVTGVGLCADTDLLTALEEAASKARSECPEPAVVLAFITFNYPAGELAAAANKLSDAFPDAVCAGGQVNGLTFEDERYDAVFANRHAVAVVCFGGDGIRGAAALRPDVSHDNARSLGGTLAQDALAKLGVPAVGGILFGLGLASVPALDQQLVNGVRDVAPRLRLSGTGFCGGMTTEGMNLPGRAFLGRDLVEQGAMLLVLGGSSLRLGFSVANGMKATGRGAFVTKAEGPEIVEMDGRPAKEVVLELLAGDSAEDRAMFEKNPTVTSIEKGVALAAPDIEGEFHWCHAVAMFTPRGGAIDAFGPRKGMGLAVVRIDPESCMDAVGEAAKMLEEDAGGDSFEFTLAFSCALRGFTLGANIAREDAEFRRHVNTRRHLGVIANGEIGCYRHGRPAFTGWVFALMGALAG